MSVLTLRASVTGIVDSQLAAAADGFTYSVTKYRATTLPSGTRPEPDSMKPLTQVVGQAPGNIVLLVRDGEVVDSALFGDGDAGPVPAAAIAELAGQSWVRDRSETVWLPELGLYRMVGRPGGGGKLLVTSASLRPASEAASRETVTVGILTALASLVTALSTLAVVRVALRTDDGPGIDAAMLPHLFERFVRADKSRSRQAGNSFGLGLAITSAIVEAHLGSIVAESSYGTTVFTILLPSNSSQLALST